MKPFNSKSFVLIALLGIAISLPAQTLREESQKDFNTTDKSSLSIENQFGNIVVTDWDQNKVEIKTIIEVKDSDEVRGKKLMERISIEFKEENGKISVRTVIKNAPSETRHEKNTKQSFRIDYFVKCPRTIPVSLENQFGDISLATLTGPVDVELQFGSLNAVSLTGPDVDIEAQFGKINISDLNQATLEVQHVDVVEITKAATLSVEGQFTEVRIGSVGDLEAEMNSGNMVVDKLTGKLDLESNMGSIRVKDIGPDFTEIKVEQNMGEVNLTVDPKAGYQLTAVANMGSIDVPEGVRKTQVTDKQGEHKEMDINTKHVKGTFGNGRSVIQVKVNMGSLTIL